jgi:hypothetical protein
MALRDNAAKLARPESDPDWPTVAKPGSGNQPAQDTTPDPQPDEDDAPEMPTEDAEIVPVHVAWQRVMTGVRQIAKKDKYDAPGTKFDFRGVDRTVNAFAPVVREHGVLVLPVAVDASYRDTKSSKGTPMRECTVTVTWMVIGPAGDTLPSTLQSAGEALDSSDKGTAKAQSVALRVLLLNAAMVPTGDPDPDSQVIDRGEAAVRSAASYVEEIFDPKTSPGRIRQIHYELKQTGQLGVLVTNDVGDEEQIGPMVVRVGKERGL